MIAGGLGPPGPVDDRSEPGDSGGRINRPGRPLESPGAIGRVRPFGVAAVLGITTVVVPSGPRDDTLVVAALALTGAIIAGCVVVPWRRLPAAWQAAPPFLYFAVVAMLRHAEGGAASGMSPLLLLPFFWLSLHGSGKQLAVATIAAAAVLTLPILLIGSPQYPPSEWRRA